MAYSVPKPRAIPVPVPETAYAYNQAGELVRGESPRRTMEYAYGPDHLLAAVATGGKTIERMTYDDAGRLTSLSRGDGANRAEFAFEQRPDGRLVVEQKPTGRRLVYDAKLQLVAVESRGGQTRYEYADDGTTKSVVHESESRLVSKVAYDRRETGTDVHCEASSGAAVDYSLDPAGKVRSLKVNGQSVGQFQYDLATGQVDSASFPSFEYRRVPDVHGGVRDVFRATTTTGDAGQSLNVFRDRGKLTALKGPDGMSLSVAYDGDRVASIGSPRRTVTFTEEAGQDGGRVHRMASTDGRTEAVYLDRQGRMEKATVAVGDATREVCFEHGRPVLVRDFDGGQTRYEWNHENGQLVGVEDAIGGRISYAYEPAGSGHRLANVTLPNGRTIEFRYDGQGRLREVLE